MSEDIDWYATLLEELGTVLGTMVNASVDGITSTMTGRVWSVRIEMAGAPRVTLDFDEVGTAALVQAVHGPDNAPSPDAIHETLEELCNQTAAAMARRSGDDSATPEVTLPALVVWVPSVQATTRTFTSPALHASLTVSASANHDPAVDMAPVAGTRADDAREPSANERLDVLLDIDLPLVVRFGCTDMPLKALARLGPGSIIDLGRAPDDPVEVLVGNRVVARAEVVVVSGSYGIRIVDVVSERDRIRELEV